MISEIRHEADRDLEFSRWIGSRPGAESLAQCIHCGQCTASCPLSDRMDRSPRRLLYLAKEGFRREVLESFTLWLCTSCYTCTIKCPRGIKVTDLLYALKRRAIEAGTYPKRFAIPVLAQEFRRMVLRDGRINETLLAAAMIWKTNPARLVAMSGLGRGLLRTGRMSLKRDRIVGRAQLTRLLREVEASAPTGNGEVAS
jgi:heterodisulfide reductase subunit C/quinone-modifying oxidoreductase subunit QmoC